MDQPTRLQRLLHPSLQRWPNRVAIRTESASFTYSDLDDRVRRVAAGLKEAGVRLGDRVAWLLPNCMEAVLTTMACYQLGATVVPLHDRCVAEELDEMLCRTRAVMFVYHAKCEDIVQAATRSMKELAMRRVGDPRGLHASFDELLLSEPMLRDANVTPGHSALILFTSGSTGRPKGVVHSHEGAARAIDISGQLFDFKDDDIVLVGKSLSHAGGLQTQLMPALHAGGSVVLARSPGPAQAVALIKEHAVTEYGLLASDLLDFVEYLEGNPIELPSLRNCIGSGDSVAVDLHHRFRDLFGWEVMEGAGMTEIGGYYAANPLHGKRKWGSLGLPTPETEIQIVQENGDECVARQQGEILIRTPSATTGYLDDPEATARLHFGDWLRSGDLGYKDEDGYIWFAGRKKLMIVRRGSDIAPAEVEKVLGQHPLVRACVVVGLDDPRDGQVPVACVVLLGDETDGLESDLRTYVQARLAAFKNPKHYLFLDRLPRTSTGKRDRNQLRERVQRDFGS